MQRTVREWNITFECTRAHWCASDSLVLSAHTRKSHWAITFTTISHKGSNIYILFILAFRCLFTQFPSCAPSLHSLFAFVHSPSAKSLVDYAPSAANKWKKWILSAHCIRLSNILVVLVLVLMLLLLLLHLPAFLCSSFSDLCLFSFHLELCKCITQKQTYRIKLIIEAEDQSIHATAKWM